MLDHYRERLYKEYWTVTENAHEAIISINSRKYFLCQSYFNNLGVVKKRIICYNLGKQMLAVSHSTGYKIMRRNLATCRWCGI